MVATDTVVGIVGAVLLVGVMVGIYVYEFNQAEDAGTDTDGGLGSGPAMIDASGDLDGDGTPNGADDDIDGDSIPNSEDNKTAYTFSFTGSLAPGATERVFTNEIMAENGTQAIRVNVTWTSTTPTPLPATPNFAVSLVGPEGEVVAQATMDRTGTSVTAMIVADGGLPGGAYTLRVTEGPGMGGEFAAEGVVEYA